AHPRQQVEDSGNDRIRVPGPGGLRSDDGASQDDGLLQAVPLEELDSFTCRKCGECRTAQLNKKTLHSLHYLHVKRSLRETKISIRVLEAHVLDEPAHEIQVIGQLAILDLPAEKIAQHAPEILVTWVGHERS